VRAVRVVLGVELLREVRDGFAPAEPLERGKGDDTGESSGERGA
jgi:hypothetical protein